MPLHYGKMPSWFFGRMAQLLVLLILLALVFCGISGYCQEISVVSKVDKDRLTQAECLTLTIIICGEMKKRPRIELPELEDFVILSKKSSHNISIEKGKTRYSSEFDFTLKPKSVGKLTIGPARLKYRKRVYETEPIVIEVLPAGPERPAQPEERKVPRLEGGILI